MWCCGRSRRSHTLSTDPVLKMKMLGQRSAFFYKTRNKYLFDVVRKICSCLDRNAANEALAYMLRASGIK